MPKKKCNNGKLVSSLAQIAATGVVYDHSAVFGVLRGCNIADALSWLAKVFGIRNPRDSAHDLMWFYYGPTDCVFRVRKLEVPESSSYFPCRAVSREDFEKVRDLLIQLGFKITGSRYEVHEHYALLQSDELGFSINLAWRETVPEDPQDTPPWSPGEDGDGEE